MISRPHAAMPENLFRLSSENWHQVQNLVAEVLERPADERSAFLRQACGHDRDLHREVESLLLAYEKAGAFLESLDTAGAAALMAEERDAAVGTVVGPYRIQSVLGRGGMGVVYRAEDLRLDRSVALKFLPSNLAADGASRQRLLAEARAAAALDHTHISVVHEISETDDGRPFIAMAYYEGQTLRDMISRAPLPIALVIRIAGQVADGLRAAHRQGVIHRDIKPSNILITSPESDPSEDGVVKIVDFGIARLVDAEQKKTEATLGTVSYMSPEQTRGHAVDQRTDLWSLGIVIYEMLTGRRPFQGDSRREVVQSILNDDPEPISKLRRSVPAGLEAVVNQCLVKDPQARCSSATEVLAQLESLTGAVGSDAANRPAIARTPAILVTILAISVGVAVTQLIAPSTPPHGEPPRRVRLTSYPGIESMPAFSPDGSRIAFAWNGREGDAWDLDIYLKQLGGSAYDPIQLTSHSDVDYAPAWSPDGRYVAFVRHERIPDGVGIYRVPASGGRAEKVASLRIPSRISWSSDGTALIFVDKDSAAARSAIYRLSMETLERQKLTNPPAGMEDLDARISPDGSMLAIVRGKRNMPVLQNLLGDMTNAGSDLYVASHPGGAPKQLTFDRSAINGLSWTPDSREVVYSSDRVNGYGFLRLWRVPAHGGRSEPISSRGDRNLYPAVSPNGTLLAHVEATMRRGSFWHYDIGRKKDRTVPELLIHSSAREISAEYSPDGTRIVFASQRSGSDEIWVCDSDGRNPVQLTFIGGPRTGSPSWSPDGKYIAFDSWLKGGAQPHIFVISSQGGELQRITLDSAHGGVPSWSRDGLWIYSGNGRGEVWKTPVHGGRAIRVASEGYSPRESPDGKWVYYVKVSPIQEGAIWRKPVGGGRESPVLDDFRANPWGSWIVFNDGIYYFDRDGQGHHSVKLLDLTTREATTVAELPQYGGYMHVSPDREHLLVRRMEGGDVDLVLTEYWR